MGPPADPSPATSTELEHLEEEQPLGEAANLGCPGVETPDAIATAVSSGTTGIAGKTAIPGGPATGIPTATPGGPVAALTAATPGGAKTIQAETGKTRTRGGRKTGQKIEGIKDYRGRGEKTSITTNARIDAKTRRGRCQPNLRSIGARATWHAEAAQGSRRLSKVLSSCPG